MFGGSASAVAILAAWSLLHTRLTAAGMSARLVIQRNSMSYEQPMAGDFTACASTPSAEAWAAFVRMFERKGRARISSCHRPSGTRGAKPAALRASSWRSHPPERAGQRGAIPIAKAWPKRARAWLQVSGQHRADAADRPVGRHAAHRVQQRRARACDAGPGCERARQQPGQQHHQQLAEFDADVEGEQRRATGGCRAARSA